MQFKCRWMTGAVQKQVSKNEDLLLKKFLEIQMDKLAVAEHSLLYPYIGYGWRIKTSFYEWIELIHFHVTHNLYLPLWPATWIQVFFSSVMKSIVIHRYTRIIGLYQDGFLPKMYVSYCKFIPFYMAYSPKFRHLKFIFVHGYRRIITLLVKSRESFSHSN